MRRGPPNLLGPGRLVALQSPVCAACYDTPGSRCCTAKLEDGMYNAERRDTSNQFASAELRSAFMRNAGWQNNSGRRGGGRGQSPAAGPGDMACACPGWPIRVL